MTIDADLGPVSPRGVAAFLSSIENLYQICFFANKWSDRRPLRPYENLWIASLRMASPLHVAAAAAGDAGDAAGKVGELVEAVATLGSKRKVASSEAAIAEQTIAARVLQEQAAARKALAEAVQAEQLGVQARLESIRQIIDIARSLDDNDLLEGAKSQAQQLLGPDVASEAVEAAAAQLTILIAPTRAIGASGTFVRPDE